MKLQTIFQPLEELAALADRLMTLSDSMYVDDPNSYRCREAAAIACQLDTLRRKMNP